MIDLREFILDEDGNPGKFRLPFLNTPLSLSSDNAPFMKGFGRLRSRDGSIDWLNEEFYFKADNGVKMPEFIKHIQTEVLPSDKFGGYGICKARRIFFNGFFVRCEISFFLKTADYHTTYTRDARQIIRSLLSQRVKVVDFDLKDKIESNFFSLTFRKRLSKAIEHSSSNDRTIRGYVKSGRPLIYIEYSNDAEGKPVIMMPNSSKQFALAGELSGVKIDYFTQHEGGQPVDVWCILYPRDWPVSKIREIRLGILKTHSFVQSSIILLSNIGKVISANGGNRPFNLQEYSKYIFDFFENDFYIDKELSQLQSSIKSIFLKLQTNSIRSTIVDLKKEVRLFGKEEAETLNSSIARSTINIGSAIITGGSVVTKSYGNIYGGSGVMIIDSEQVSQIYNNVNESPVNDEKKKALNQVNDEILKLIESLPADKAEDAMKALRELNEQATKEKPNKRWFDVSVEGLLDAAKAVSDVISGPAITAITALTRLFP